MKKAYTIIFFLLAALSMQAQKKHTVYVWNNGNKTTMAGVDSITYTSASTTTVDDDLLERLRKVANKFIGKINSADFTNVASITNALNNIDDDNDAVSDWADECVKAITDQTGSRYNRIWAASNFTGHFTVSGNKWIRQAGSYSDLQFTMTDDQGRTCVGKVTWSGTVRKVHADFLDWTEEEDSYPYDEYTPKNEWQVPEHVVATVTQNGTEISRVTVNTTFSKDGDFPTQADANIVINVKVNNYEVNINKASATGNSKAEADITVKVNGEQLMHATGNADASYSDEEVTVGATTIKCDVLGEVQLSTYTSNLKQYSNLLELDDMMTESQAKSQVSQANQLATNTLCLDNSTTASATFYFKPVQEDDYYSLSQSQYWEAAPVLKIASDGREVEFEDYFSEDNFRTVIDNYDTLVDSFKTLFDY